MLDRSEIRSVVVTQGRIIIFKNRSYICCFENVREIDVSREILAKKEMGLLSPLLNSFKKLFGMLAGPNDFPTFSEMIIDATSSSFVALNVKVFSTGSEK